MLFEDAKKMIDNLTEGEEDGFETVVLHSINEGSKPVKYVGFYVLELCYSEEQGYHEPRFTEDDTYILEIPEDTLPRIYQCGDEVTFNINGEEISYKILGLKKCRYTASKIKYSVENGVISAAEFPV